MNRPRTAPVDESLTSDPSLAVRVGSILPLTEAEGPGRRFAVWAQGCTIRCVGCFNPHLWGSSGGQLVPIQDLASQAAQSGAEGVTLLGGEPFDQASAFGAFARLVQDHGMSVMTFTGHTLEHLNSPTAPVGSESLLSATDLLVDGPYQADRLDVVRPWVGSTNQRFHFLTDRYASLSEDLTHQSDKLEVRVGPTGVLEVNGWAQVASLDELLSDTSHGIARGSIR